MGQTLHSQVDQSIYNYVSDPGMNTNQTEGLSEIVSKSKEIQENVPVSKPGEQIKSSLNLQKINEEQPEAKADKQITEQNDENTRTKIDLLNINKKIMQK